MLRALGVVFIVCCCFGAGLLGCGFVWVCLETDVIGRLTGNTGRRSVDLNEADATYGQSGVLEVIRSAALDQELCDQREGRQIILSQSTADGPASPVGAAYETSVPSTPQIQQVASEPAAQPQLLSATLMQPGDSKAQLVSVQVGGLYWVITPTGEIQGASTDTRVLRLPRAAKDRDGVILVVSGQKDVPLTNFKANLTLHQAGGQSIEPEANDGDKLLDRRTVTIPPSKLEEGRLDFDLSKVENRITLVVPKPVAGVTGITQTASGRYRAPDSAPATGTSISTYDSFLRVRFDLPASVSRTDFAVFRIDSENQRVFTGNIRSQQFAPPSGTIRDLELPLPDGVNVGEVYVVSDINGEHAYSAGLRFQRTAPLASGQITASNAAVKNVTKYNGTFYTNQDTLTLTADVSAPAGAADLVLVAFARGKTGDVARANVPDGHNGALEISNVRLSSEKANTILLQVFQGNHAVSEAAAVDVMLLRGGPSVQNVDSFNFSFTPQGSRITVVFDSGHPLNRATAENTSNFKLINAAGTPTPATKAQFDEVRNAVNLDFGNQAAPGMYSLRIENGTAGTSPAVKKEDEPKVTPTTAAPAATGIQDIAGNALQSDANNASGSPYETQVVKPVGAELPSEMRGIVGVTGPYVPYQEYTDPRTVPTGFNPSDKVISRVVRLYYFRDAHRVSQIVNRKVASYGRQAVDMAQQLADVARGAHDEARLRRRELERQAVVSAREARASEEAVQQQQQALITARNQLSDVTTQHEQLKLDLAEETDTRDELQQTLDTAQADQKAATDDLPNKKNQLTDAQNALKDRQKELDDLKKANADPAAIAAKQQQFNDATKTLNQRQAELDATQSRITTADRTISETKGPLEASQDKVRTLNAANTSAQLAVQNAQSQVDAIEGNVRNLLAEVQTKRTREIEFTEAWDSAEDREQLASREEFQRTVNAKRADPDTYAAGDPDSDDPIEQVSISVVGEGLIQLRGPRKGVNLVHTMIDQLDAPVGQVRVTVHTVQVNGEHGDRMEKVAMRIQQYLDHASFLTVRSSEMLRNAVVTVASNYAQQVESTSPPDATQAYRDLKYQEAFFGADFIHELREMDSEFLKTGNKVLSLHSMDTTSLANALFLLALAKNETRREILDAFNMQVQCNLPIEEQRNFISSGAERKYRCQEFKFMAQNAQFVSLQGFFDADVHGTDTLNPLQREFIRLAQIFKAQLVTEIELRQRVMERALIEERIGNNYTELLQKAQREEASAHDKLSRAASDRREQQKKLVKGFSQLSGNATSLMNVDLPLQFLNRRIRDQIKQGRTAKDESVNLDDFRSSAWSAASSDVAVAVGKQYDVSLNGIPIPIVIGCRQPDCTSCEFKDRIVSIVDTGNLPRPKAELEALWRSEFDGSVNQLSRFFDFVWQVNLHSAELRRVRQKEHKYFQALRRSSDGSGMDPWDLGNLFIISIAADELAPIEQHLDDTISGYLKDANALAMSLSDRDFDAKSAFTEWTKIKEEVGAQLNAGEFRQRVAGWFAPIDTGFDQLLQSEVEFKFAKELAETSRRPLDHKKFLDMLIDDVEEKYIDLREGTRAHTANVDNYVKRIATALEDDFNRQFYFPAFRYIRETSYTWDVNLGQIETTSILGNNREFAKVSPQATMEFDLPKRDFLLKEAFDSALAAYNDMGALMNDPNFLALTRMYGGLPTSDTFGGNSPAPQVRNVLPGLPSQTGEQYLSQAQNNVPEFGSNLEALIPDPAIYKFETGTGFEIRPVIQPDGQAVVFHLQYLYSTNVREPVRADEKHLGRVKQHYIDTDVSLANYELKEVSRYQVALKASRTSRGVPLLEDIPGLGILFRPLPQQESSLQENLILAQSVIYPTLFDLMGLRWAPAVADLDSLSLQEREFVYRNREKVLRNEVFDYSSLQVDDFMRIPETERRGDLYRTQETIPFQHPNGYSGRGLNIQDSNLREEYDPREVRPETPFVPNDSKTAPLQVAPPSLFQGDGVWESSGGTSALESNRTSTPVSHRGTPASANAGYLEEEGIARSRLSPASGTSAARPAGALEPLPAPAALAPIDGRTATPIHNNGTTAERKQPGWLRRLNPVRSGGPARLDGTNRSTGDAGIVPIEHREPAAETPPRTGLRKLFRR